MAETSRRLSPARRARILAAARHLILLNGLRATTMEAIAREARVAKPTLYGYFPDKEAVFGAIIEDLAATIGQVVATALSGEGDAVARIGEALAAKHRIIARTLKGSPHAAELYSERGRSAPEAFAALDRVMDEAIGAALLRAGVERPRMLTRLLLAAAQGIASMAAAPAEIGPAVRFMVERLVRPDLPR